MSPLSSTEMPSHEAHCGMCFCMWWWLQTCSLTSPVVFCRTDQLEEVLKQLEKSLTDKCSEYFDEVESTIVDVNQSFSFLLLQLQKQMCIPTSCCVFSFFFSFFFLQYFFKHGYCKIAIKGLEDFCKDFDDPMNRKDTSMEMVCMYVSYKYGLYVHVTGTC